MSDKKFAKVLNLSIAERLKASYILNEFKGSLEKLAVILEDIKQFPLSQEELTKIEGNIITNPNGMQTVNWKVELEPTIAKDINLQEITLEYLKSAIKAKSDRGEFGLGDTAIISLQAKLN
jgi:hypothetical protein